VNVRVDLFTQGRALLMTDRVLAPAAAKQGGLYDFAEAAVGLMAVASRLVR
jgi:hypothetical protein